MSKTVPSASLGIATLCEASQLFTHIPTEWPLIATELLVTSQWIGRKPWQPSHPPVTQLLAPASCQHTSSKTATGKSGPITNVFHYFQISADNVYLIFVGHLHIFRNSHFRTTLGNGQDGLTIVVLELMCHIFCFLDHFQFNSGIPFIAKVS